MTKSQSENYAAKYAAKSGAGVPLGAPERTSSDDRAAARFWMAYAALLSLWLALLVYWYCTK